MSESGQYEIRIKASAEREMDSLTPAIVARVSMQFSPWNLRLDLAGAKGFGVVMSIGCGLDHTACFILLTTPPEL